MMTQLPISNAASSSGARGLAARASAWVLASTMLAACSDGTASSGGGLIFDQPRQQLGQLISGEVRELSFDYQVGSADVVPTGFHTTCGCINVHFWQDGEKLPLNQPLPAGSQGQLKVEWKTAGFLGEKKSTVQILGTGPGLPQALHFTGTLEPWFLLEQPVADLGVADGNSEIRHQVTVRGPEPFRLLDVLAGAPPLEIAGLPSAEAATEHQFELVLPAGKGEEGEHKGFVQLRTDQPYTLTVPLKYQIAGDLWLKPSRRLLLGGLSQGVSHTSVMEVGVRVGELQEPKVRWQGADGVEISVVTLEELKRYQIKVVLPSDLALGPVTGKIYLQLLHRNRDQVQSLERVVQLLGVIRAPE